MPIFLTGFPGFLGSELLPRLIARSDDYAVCLVQPKFRVLAEERVRQLGLGDRVRLVEGDLTAALDHIDASDIREIWHLAAVYDLTVPREVGMRVNGGIAYIDSARHAIEVEHFRQPEIRVPVAHVADTAVQQRGR